MKYIKRTLFLLVMGLGLMAPVQAEEVHMVMCGGEIREADKVVIAAFEKLVILVSLLMQKRFLGARVRIKQ